MLAVVGPTGTGKSDLAVELALRTGAEIVNADAFQLYRGMDIGTAKLSVGARRGVPHHQLDVLELHEEASVAAYQRHAAADVAAVRARGRLPLLVGGSGLYVRALVDDLTFPGTDPKVRRAVEEDLAGLTDEAAHRLLARHDPAAAAAIERGNRRRVVRALEVIRLTGRPFSANLPDYSRDTVPQLGLEVRDPQILDRLVEQRVHRMVAAGFVAEVARLRRKGLDRSRTASRAIGYPQFAAHLDGELTEAEAVAATTLATRQLIRRQRRWFRRDPRVVWFDATARDLVDGATEFVLSRA